MPIRVSLDRVLLDRRMSLTELADRVGVTIANLSILKTGKARAVRFSTLAALCRELDCQPGDLAGLRGGARRRLPRRGRGRLGPLPLGQRPLCTRVQAVRHCSADLFIERRNT